MTSVSTILVLLAAVTAMAIAARRAKLPYPAVMVIGGLLIAWVPKLPHLALSPDVFFTLFLPPLLYAAAWQTSWRDFKLNLRPILLLAIGFVVFTTVVVAAFAHWLVPGMPWAAALALGAIVSPPDAAAASATASLLRVPRRLITILEGESLVNDASGLTLYKLAVAAAVTGTFSWSNAIWTGASSVGLGVGLGLIIGWLIMRLHRLMNDPLQETVITLLSPFAAFIVAEHLHGSGVLAVVTMGLFISRHSHAIFAPTTRLQAYSVWNTTEFVFNGLVFVLIGLQLPIVVSHFQEGDLSRATLLMWSGGLCVVVVLVRMAWVFPASYLPHLLARILGRRDPMPSWKIVFLVAYTGMRGATSLAAALALPLFIAGGAEFPRRNLIIFFSFVVILATLVVQSLTLPPIIRALGIKPDRENQCEEWEARLRASEAALERVKQLEGECTGSDAVRKRTLRGLRNRYEAR
ncbi:MAG: Na+/H+ antiporter, partial [Phycisphaerae bacterium]|nr:Na+/H+ antiporter [Phycisphaerae bacterium]